MIPKVCYEDPESGFSIRNIHFLKDLDPETKDNTHYIKLYYHYGAVVNYHYEVATVKKNLNIDANEFSMSYMACHDNDILVYSDHGIADTFFSSNNIFRYNNQNKILPDVEKIYKVIFNGRGCDTSHKNQHLCRDLEGLVLADANTYSNPSIVPCINNAHFINEFMQPKELTILYNQARMGIMLSLSEACCWSQYEYLLCGLPVVTCKANCGRNLFMNEYNSITIDFELGFMDDPRWHGYEIPKGAISKDKEEWCIQQVTDAVAAMELRLDNGDIDPYKVRSQAINDTILYQESYMNEIKRIVASRGLIYNQNYANFSVIRKES